MKYEKLKIPEREEAFKIKMKSLFNSSMSVMNVELMKTPPFHNSVLLELEQLGYRSLTELLYYSTEDILTLKSALANGIRLVSDVLKELFGDRFNHNLYIDAINVTTLETPKVCINKLKSQIVWDEVSSYSMASSIRVADEKSLIGYIDHNLSQYTFEYAYDEENNYLVLIALTETQRRDIIHEKHQEWVAKAKSGLNRLMIK